MFFVNLIYLFEVGYFHSCCFYFTAAAAVGLGSNSQGLLIAFNPRNVSTLNPGRVVVLSVNLVVVVFLSANLRSGLSLEFEWLCLSLCYVFILCLNLSTLSFSFPTLSHYFSFSFIYFS